MDGAVLLGGCDKTSPARLMGATSMDLPTIFVRTGPMMLGNGRERISGRGSDVRKYRAEKRAGEIGERVWDEVEDGIAHSPAWYTH